MNNKAKSLVNGVTSPHLKEKSHGGKSTGSDAYKSSRFKRKEPKAKIRMKVRNGEMKSYTYVPETSGKITDSIWISDDKTILCIDFATGQSLYFEPI